MANYTYRTAITRLKATTEQQERLEETISEYRRGCQIATDLGWTDYTDKSALQSLAYDDIREQTELQSQHAILASHAAAEAMSGCERRLERGRPVSKPRFTSPTVQYDSRTMTLFEEGAVSLATTKSRVRCSLVLPEDDDGYQWQYLEDDAWKITESSLTARDGDYYLHLGFRRHMTSPEHETAEDGTVLGVDLGVENIAVTSTAQFVAGGEAKHIINEFETVRAGLQQTGTQSAHRTLQSVSGRQRRYLRDLTHRVANNIVDEAKRYECTTIAFEKLDHIREETTGSWGHVWAFRRLIEYVEYKAHEVGIGVQQVSPAETSIRCAECGHTDKNNRPERTRFTCEECGVEANADYNAAKNIGMRCIRRGQQSSRRAGDGQLALKSGTVTPTSGFSPYPDGFEVEFTDKSSNFTSPS